MDIYEMFYLCTSFYFSTQKDMHLKAVIYTPTVHDIVLHIDFTCCNEAMVANIEFDEDGESKWRIKIEDIIYEYDFVDNLTFNIIGHTINKHIEFLK